MYIGVVIIMKLSFVPTNYDVLKWGKKHLETVRFLVMVAKHEVKKTQSNIFT